MLVHSAAPHYLLGMARVSSTRLSVPALPLPGLFFSFWGWAKCFLYMVMAYNCFLAICYPLLYSIIISPSWAIGFIMSTGYIPVLQHPDHLFHNAHLSVTLLWTQWGGLLLLWHCHDAGACLCGYIGIGDGGLHHHEYESVAFSSFSSSSPLIAHWSTLSCRSAQSRATFLNLVTR